METKGLLDCSDGRSFTRFPLGSGINGNLIQNGFLVSPRHFGPASLWEVESMETTGG